MMHVTTLMQVMMQAMGDGGVHDISMLLETTTFAM